MNSLDYGMVQPDSITIPVAEALESNERHDHWILFPVVLLVTQLVIFTFMPPYTGSSTNPRPYGMDLHSLATTVYISPSSVKLLPDRPHISASAR